MRNLSSVRHLIGGGIHELMSWMEIKRFPSHSFLEILKKGDAKKRRSRIKSFRSRRLCGQLEATADDTTELLDTDVLALDLGAGLVLLVGRHADDGTIDLPAADVDDELVERVTAADIEPGLEVLGGDGAEGVADLNGDADADEFLEAGNVGGQVCVQVVRVQSGPELGVLGGLEE